MTPNPPLRIKLNGLNDPAAIDAALTHKADFIGFIFTAHPARIAPPLAGQLTRDIPPTTSIVGCFRDPLDAELEDCLSQVPLDYIQLNGNEDPARVHELRQHFGLPIIKTIALASPADLQDAAQYEQAADYLIFTARAPANVHSMHASADWPFDWSLLAQYKGHRPWFLGGGISPDNFSAALMATGARYLDITAGISGKNGQSCPVLIAEILGKRQALSPILASTILE